MDDTPIETKSASPASETPPAAPVLPVTEDHKPLPPAGPSERLKSWVDVVNKLAQIVALIAAGSWGLWLFIETTEPGLEPKLTVDVGIDWTSLRSPGECQADLSATVKNPGANTITIDHVQIKLWLHDPSAGATASRGTA
jgi:hypothetical protein